MSATVKSAAPTAASVVLACAHEFAVELRTQARGGEALAWWPATGDIPDLIDEAHTTGVLAGALPIAREPLQVTVVPEFDPEPWVRAVVVTVVARGGGRHEQRFASGRFERRATAALAAGRTAARPDDRVHVVLTATPNATLALQPPLLEPPLVVDGTLADFGVRELDAGGLAADRPVLVCARAAGEILALTTAAGPTEVGGGMLGALVRLPAPLPGTSTRIVTLLSACVTDGRHAGSFARLQFDPQAMADAAELAALRGRGERVLTVFHSHGWGKDCGRCNESATCTLASCEHVSLDDYQVLEAMFPSKTTVFPIAGRRLGAPSGRPALAIHAWRGGRVRPVEWMSYRD